MKLYTRPDVYIEREYQPLKIDTSISPSVVAFVGITPRGEINKPKPIYSFSDFKDTFSMGVSPYIEGSFLSHAVEGFYKNKGGKCYVLNVKGEDSKKASITLNQEEENPIKIEAIDYGEWGNNLEVKITSNDLGFNVIILLNKEEIEKFEVVNEKESENYFMNVINTSKYIRINAELLVATEGKLEGGTLGKVNDQDYIKALVNLDPVEDVVAIAIPGVTSDTVIKGLQDYCDQREDCIPIPDLPKNLSDEEVLEKRDSLFGATVTGLYYPWIKISDPTSPTGKLMLCPPSGHVLGVTSRTHEERGVHKAPAGISANIKGVISLERNVSATSIGLLNSKGINCLVAKNNYGIIVWGARMLNGKYISEEYLYQYIDKSLHNKLQFAVFESNDPVLWNKIISEVKTFMNDLYLSGAFFGNSPDEAYFVKCDEEINPESERDKGYVNCEVGYAGKKVGEFIIVRLREKLNK